VEDGQSQIVFIVPDDKGRPTAVYSTREQAQRHLYESGRNIYSVQGWAVHDRVIPRPTWDEVRSSLTNSHLDK
jgi:hypothetical protein